MSGPDDDELLEIFKELKNKKDVLEDMFIPLENRESFLKFSLLEPIVKTRWISTEKKACIPGRITQRFTVGKNQNCLQDSFATILDWVKRTEILRTDKSVTRRIEESLNKAITWASCTTPEEEDLIMRKLLERSLLDALNWVEQIVIPERQIVFKIHLLDSLLVALDWTSRPGGDDEVMVQALAAYIIITDMWTTVKEEKFREDTLEINRSIKDAEDAGEGDIDELEEQERQKNARQELQQCLKDIFNWVMSIDAKRDERAMQREVLDSLVILMHWIKTKAGSQDDEVMKQILQETLMVSLNWVILVDEGEGEDIRQRLVDSLIFLINWSTSDENRGHDEIMRALLRQTLKTAIQWKKGIDHQPD